MKWFFWFLSVYLQVSKLKAWICLLMTKIHLLIVSLSHYYMKVVQWTKVKKALIMLQWIKQSIHFLMRAYLLYLKSLSSSLNLVFGHPYLPHLTQPSYLAIHLSLHCSNFIRYISLISWYPYQTSIHLPFQPSYPYSYRISILIWMYFVGSIFMVKQKACFQLV